MVDALTTDLMYGAWPAEDPPAVCTQLRRGAPVHHDPLGDAWRASRTIGPWSATPVTSTPVPREVSTRG